MKIAVLHTAGNAGFFPRYYNSFYKIAMEYGDEMSLFCPNSGVNIRNPLPNQVIWGTRFNWFFHYKLYRLTGLQDIFSVFETISLIVKLKNYSPDIIHLNIVNVWNLNIPLLVRYINKNKIPVVWTMHDCRAFTGFCPFFDEIGCVKWQTGCGNCPKPVQYRPTFIDNTHLQWKIRRKFLTSIKKMIIVTPSNWLAGLVSMSFLGKYPIKTIYNGVDLNVFSKSFNYDLVRKYNLFGKKVVLGCAVIWTARKGLDHFMKLSSLLPCNYQIVIVGTARIEDQELLRQFGILYIGKTSSIEELVSWYKTAMVFCNPTIADNFPTTNIEALASGTPVVTYNTGGSPEAINDKTGVVVEKNNIQALRDAVVKIVESRDVNTTEACIEMSRNFSPDQYRLYFELFQSLLE